jgi:cobalt-zinc-cadmium efflux system outer membrane protein
LLARVPVVRMLLRHAAVCALGVALALPGPLAASAESSGALTLAKALQRALTANPRLTIADREVGMAAGRRTQAGAVPNPEASFELDNAFGSGQFQGLRSAETTLQLSQLIELGGKREARVAAGTAALDSARWERAAARLDVLSETAVAFFNVLSAQRRVQIHDVQIASLDRLVPLLQRRVEAGASSPAEVSRAQVAADLVRVERERAKTASAIARRELAALMGANSPDFSQAVGDLNRVGRPPAFQTVLRAIESNPQLIRWTAVRAQRNAELLSARLKPIPDIGASVAWRHFQDTNDNAVRLGLSVPLAVWDQNQGSIVEAQESLAKTDAERASSKAALILTLGRAYDTLVGSLRELDLLRTSVIPNARKAVEGMESGYSQGRFTLLELLDVQDTVMQAELRELDALINFHTSIATIEGLTGSPVALSRESAR